MPGTLNVGGHNIITHSGTSGAGTINLVDQAGNAILTDSGSGMSLNSNVAFPAGHIIRSFYKEGDNSGNLSIGTGGAAFNQLEIEIPGTNDTNNKLLVNCHVTAYVNVALTSLYTYIMWSDDNFSTQSIFGYGSPVARIGYLDNNAERINTTAFSVQASHPTTSSYKIRLFAYKVGSGTVQIYNSGSSVLPIMNAFEIKG